MNKLKQAMIVIKQIKGLYDSCIKSKSPYLKNDYEKKIKSLKKELKEYCGYKHFNYKQLCEMNNI